MLPDIQPGNTKILYFFNCLLDGMHTKTWFYVMSSGVMLKVVVMELARIIQFI